MHSNSELRNVNSFKESSKTLCKELNNAPNYKLFSFSVTEYLKHGYHCVVMPLTGVQTSKKILEFSWEKPRN